MGLPVARLTDIHICPMLTGPVPHVGGPIIQSSCVTVLIGMIPAATVGSVATCIGPPDTLPMGSQTVLIGNLPVVRMADTTAHGGTVVMGYPTVLIG